MFRDSIKIGERTCEGVLILVSIDENLGSWALSPDFAQDFDQLKAALRDSGRQVHTVKEWVVLALSEGILIMWEHFHPAQNQLEDQADKFYDSWQVARVNLRGQCDERVQIEIEFTSDELGAFVCCCKTSELGVQDILNFLLQNDLLG